MKQNHKSQNLHALLKVSCKFVEVVALSPCPAIYCYHISSNLRRPLGSFVIRHVVKTRPTFTVAVFFINIWSLLQSFTSFPPQRNCQLPGYPRWNNFSTATCFEPFFTFYAYSSDEYQQKSWGCLRKVFTAYQYLISAFINDVSRVTKLINWKTTTKMMYLFVVLFPAISMTLKGDRHYNVTKCNK